MKQSLAQSIVLTQSRSPQPGMNESFVLGVNRVAWCGDTSCVIALRAIQIN